MKICVSSSCRFHEDWDSLRSELMEAGAEKVYLPSEAEYHDPVSEEEDINKKRKLVDSYNKFMEDSDVLYIYAKDGYAGISTATEVGYAYAKGMKIYSSEVVEDMGIRVLVDRVVAPKELAKEIK